VSYIVWTTEFIDPSFQALVTLWKKLDDAATFPSVAAIRKREGDGHDSYW